jgi:hypothetical protein
MGSGRMNLLIKREKRAIKNWNTQWEVIHILWNWHRISRHSYNQFLKNTLYWTRRTAYNPTQLAGSNPAESVGFFWCKNPQHAFLRRGSQIICPMSQIWGHVLEPSSCGSLRAAGKMRMFKFLPSLIEISRAAWCGVPLEMNEGTIPICGTKVLSARPRCITLITHS